MSSFARRFAWMFAFATSIGLVVACGGTGGDLGATADDTAADSDSSADSSESSTDSRGDEGSTGAGDADFINGTDCSCTDANGKVTPYRCPGTLCNCCPEGQENGPEIW